MHGERSVYFKFGIVPMKRNRSLSLITREDPETHKQVIFNVIARPSFQIEVEILVLDSLRANFSLD